MKGCEESGGRQEEGRRAPTRRPIKLAQDIWGKDPAFKDAVANADDVDGLISDSTFVGLPGNIAFFTAKGNLSGFAFKSAQALALPEDPATQAFKANPDGFRTADFDYDALRKLGDLNGKAVKPRTASAPNSRSTT